MAPIVVARCAVLNPVRGGVWRAQDGAPERMWPDGTTFHRRAIVANSRLFPVDPARHRAKRAEREGRNLSTTGIAGAVENDPGACNRIATSDSHRRGEQRRMAGGAGSCCVRLTSPCLFAGGRGSTPPVRAAASGTRRPRRTASHPNSDPIVIEPDIAALARRRAASKQACALSAAGSSKEIAFMTKVLPRGRAGWVENPKCGMRGFSWKHIFGELGVLRPTSRRKPVPDLIRDGYGFADKDMRQIEMLTRIQPRATAVSLP